MEFALTLLHRTLAYLVFLVGLVDTVLVISRARSDARLAAVVHWAHAVGVVWAGRVNVLAGAALWVLLPQWRVGTWWLWVSLLLWGGVEMAAVKLVRPEIALVRAGGAGSGRMVLGVVLQLICIIIIFGLMSARP